VADGSFLCTGNDVAGNGFTVAFPPHENLIIFLRIYITSLQFQVQT
jgi:hypothetical protein